MPNHEKNSVDKIQEKIRMALKLGQEMGYWSHGYDYPRWCKQLFQQTELRGKNILEIGCGKALPCIWASVQGANHVVGLEPLEEGSFDSSAIYKEFKTIVDTLNLNNIKMLPNMVQDYDFKIDFFDIVLSVASINHFDEDSCTNLHNDKSSRDAYKKIFKKIAGGMKDGGKLIILDCSRKNFFGDKGLTNPFGRSIEWFKHHTPQFWAKFLSECGFINPKITWPSGRYLRYLGVGNRNEIISYFIDSYFRLEVMCSKQ